MFDEGTGETAKHLLAMYRSSWTKPYMKPKWLKVDPHRAQVSDEFANAVERDGTELVDTAGAAKEQNGKVERHIFENMLEDVLAEVQPQTEHEWRE